MCVLDSRGPMRGTSSLANTSQGDRLEFETLLLYLRLCFLLAPALLVIAYGMRAAAPALEVEVAILVDCSLVWSLLRWYPDRALRAQLALRGIDLVVAYIALHFVHFLLQNAYYDSVYLFFVVAATATHGRRGTYVVAIVSALAVFAGRMQLIWDGVFPFEMRHVTDSLFYALLFVTTGATTEFLMKKSGEAVAARDREAADAIRESEERYRGLFENATDIVYEHDLHGNFTSFNRAAEKQLGYSDADLLGLNITDVVDPADLERARAMTALKLSQSGGTMYELRLMAKHGGRLHVEVSSQALFKGGRPVAIQGIARDITERKSLEDRLRHEALHDALTGLPNRVLFQDRIGGALLASRRSGQPMAVLLLDLDRFKPINDTFGHGCGDTLLRELARVLTSLLRESDTVARLGGDEFAVLLAASDADGACQVAEKLIHSITQPRSIEGKSVSVGISIGIALFPEHSDEVEILLKMADEAMYDAKRTGTGYALCSISANHRDPDAQAS